MIRPFAVVTLAALAAAPAALGAQSPVDRAARVYAKIRTIRATFTQTVVNPLTRNTVTSHGEILQRVPGAVCVRFTDPAGDRIVASGNVVWLYLPSTNPGQVIRSSVGAGTSVPDVTSWFLDRPAERYTISDAGTATIDGHATHAVQLVPKDPSLPFTKATIWVDDDDALIRQVDTTDQNGLTRRITLEQIEPNASIDPGVFTFKVPKGVKVYDQSAGT